MSDRPCPTCGGKRLNPAALAVTVDDVNIVEANSWPVLQTLEWVKKISGKNSPLTSKQKEDRRTRNQGNPRTTDLSGQRRFGLSDPQPLCCDLSGGEAQRIRLATQVGSRLVGVLYVLDEPSIGLHPRDNMRLLETLKGLRDLGNTVLVVEHDDETIREADWVIDLGPVAGEHGGQVIAEGTPKQILAHPKSLTGQYLSGRKQVAVPKERREGNGKSLKIVGASANNLKKIDVTIPLGKLVCITGVSGSGKSTLMSDILYNALAAKLMGARTSAGEHERSKASSISTRSSTSTSRPSGARRARTQERTRDCSMRSESCTRNCPKARCADISPDASRSMCTADAVKPVRDRANCGSKCSSCPMCMCPAMCVTGRRFNRETLQVMFRDKYSICRYSGHDR